MMTDDEGLRAATFAVIIYCANCETEEEHFFARGTALTTEGWGDGERYMLVIAK